MRKTLPWQDNERVNARNMSLHMDTASKPKMVAILHAPAEWSWRRQAGFLLARCGSTLVLLPGVDVLCVNQDDLPERGAQVQLMPRIYGSARSVLAWLGVNPTRADAILEEKVPNVFRSSRRHQEFIPDTNSTRRLLEIATTVNDICGRSYWQRMWIVQEVVLGLSLCLQYGSHKVSWECFHAWCDFFSNMLTGTPRFRIEAQVWTEFASNLREALNGFSQRIDDSLVVDLNNDRIDRGPESFPHVPLEQIIIKYDDQKCADPRDKIIALLSLAPVNTLEEYMDYKNLYEMDLRDLYRYMATHFKFEQPQHIPAWRTLFPVDS